MPWVCSLLVNIPARVWWSKERDHHLDSTGKKSRFWGRPDEVVGTLLKMWEPLPESTVRRGERLSWPSPFPISLRHQTCRFLRFLPSNQPGTSDSWRMPQSWHPANNSCFLSVGITKSCTAQHMLVSFPLSPPWPPISSPLGVGGICCLLKGWKGHCRENA